MLYVNDVPFDKLTDEGKWGVVAENLVAINQRLAAIERNNISDAAMLEFERTAAEAKRTADVAQEEFAKVGASEAPNEAPSDATALMPRRAKRSRNR